MSPFEERWIPEYRWFASDAEVDAALTTMGIERDMMRRGVRGGVLISVVTALAMVLYIDHAQTLGIPPAWGPYIITPITFGAICLVVIAPWRRARVRRALRAYLADRGEPICVECGYDLCGQVEPRCPECGTPSESVRKRLEAMAHASTPAPAPTPASPIIPSSTFCDD
jgi:hypothetical protein